MSDVFALAAPACHIPLWLLRFVFIDTAVIVVYMKKQQTVCRGNLVMAKTGSGAPGYGCA